LDLIGRQLWCHRCSVLSGGRGQRRPVGIETPPGAASCGPPRLRRRGCMNDAWQERREGPADDLRIEPYRPAHRSAALDLAIRAWTPVFARLRGAVPQFVYDSFWPDGWQA